MPHNRDMNKNPNPLVVAAATKRALVARATKPVYVSTSKKD